MHAEWVAGTVEEIATILLVKVEYEVWHPSVVVFQDALTLRVLAHQKVTIEVCPIVVGAVVWPRLLVLLRSVVVG
jgi:hypothetical protein